MVKNFLLCLTLLFCVSQVEAQSIVRYPLSIKFPNSSTVSTGSVAMASSADTLSNAAADTVIIGSLKYGDLFPIAVAIQVNLNDADVSATPDSTQVTYAVGQSGDYANVGSAVNEGVALASFTRTIVFNGFGGSVGTAAANNTQASIWPAGDQILMIFAGASDDGDSVGYNIRAFGIYQKQ